MVIRAAITCSLLGACTSDVVVTPVIEGPVDDMDATAFPNLDEVIITVAHDKSDRDLVSASFSRGEDIGIAGAPLGDDLVVHMAGFVGSSAIAYGRTCPFHVDANNDPPSPHLFFSRSVKFASLGITPLERVRGRAMSYLGTAIVLGGEANGAGVGPVERYDPATGELTTLGDLDTRTGAALALLGTSPPRVVVVGGAAGGAGARWLELVDPSRRVERVDEVGAPMARVGLTATSLTDGRVIVIGGHDPAMGVPMPVGTITELASGAPVDTRMLRKTLAYPRSGHTATRLGDDLGAPVLITGGVDGTGAPVAVAELFKPLSEELADPAVFKPLMSVPRSGHQAVRMPDNSVLIIGGIDGSGMPVKVLELFTLDGGFKTVGNLPENAGLTEMTATVLPDGRVLIIGGRTALGVVTNTAFIARLDPLDGTVDVVPTDRLAVARANHQAAILCDGTILVTGGTDNPVAAERYNPSATGRR